MPLASYQFESDEIPDSAVDNFEDQPDGLYGGEDDISLSDIYVEDTGAFSRTTDRSVTGAYSLFNDDESDAGIYADEDSGLEITPEAGNVFEFWWNLIEQRDYQETHWAVQDINEVNGRNPENGYAFESENDGSVHFYVYEDGNGTNLDSASIGYSSGEWYRTEVDWGSDGSFSITIYDDSENVQGTLSTNDTTFSSGGVGFSARGSGSGEFAWDDYDIIEL